MTNPLRDTCPKRSERLSERVFQRRRLARARCRRDLSPVGQQFPTLYKE